MAVRSMEEEAVSGRDQERSDGLGSPSYQDLTP
jgi:hypothetical protein